MIIYTHHLRRSIIQKPFCVSSCCLSCCVTKWIPLELVNVSVNEISECSEVCLLKLQASITNKIDVKNLDGPDCPSSNNLQILIQMVQSYPIQFILLTDEWMNGGKLPACLPALSLYQFIALSIYRFIALSLYRFIALSIYPIGKLSKSKSKSKSNPIQMSNKWIEDQFIALQMFSFSNTWSKNIFLGASKSVDQQNRQNYKEWQFPGLLLLFLNYLDCI